MHDIEFFGGERVEHPGGAPGLIHVQFKNAARMEAWLAMMFREYGTNHFSPSINRVTLRVVY